MDIYNLTAILIPRKHRSTYKAISFRQSFLQVCKHREERIRLALQYEPSRRHTSCILYILQEIGRLHMGGLYFLDLSSKSTIDNKSRYLPAKMINTVMKIDAATNNIYIRDELCELRPKKSLSEDVSTIGWTKVSYTKAEAVFLLAATATNVGMCCSLLGIENPGNPPPISPSLLFPPTIRFIFPPLCVCLERANLRYHILVFCKTYRWHSKYLL